MRARGRLDSHRFLAFFMAFGFVHFVGRVSSRQPPVTQTVGQRNHQSIRNNKGTFEMTRRITSYEAGYGITELP